MGIESVVVNSVKRKFSGLFDLFLFFLYPEFKLIFSIDE